jgi:hypothetical protein
MPRQLRVKEIETETRLLEFSNRGKGAAVRSGLLAARKPSAVFDADLSTPLGRHEIDRANW